MVTVTTPQSTLNPNATLPARIMTMVLKATKGKATEHKTTT